jgi:O-antigen ligase
LIPAHDIAMRSAAGARHALAVPFRERLLLIILYITILASSLAFIEPSPHDLLMGALAICCVLAGVRLERQMVLLLLLLLGWNIGGLLALLNVAGDAKTIQYAGTSVYLALAAIIFAGVFAQNSMARLERLKSAYVLTALGTTLFGLGVYVHLIPGEDMFMWVGRIKSTFKDPNVFGPFLILPALLLIEDMVTRGIKLGKLIATLILLTGIFFSFSRGAWINFGASTAVLLSLIFLTAPTPTARMRPIVLAIASAVGLALALAALLSIESVRDMLLQRAHLTNYYDVGEGGRFELQQIAIGVLFDKPFGIGPFEFSRIYGTQQHNVYLQAFLVYGWLGGLSYILLILTTLFVGLRNTLIRSPWQPYMIAAFATFVGIVTESFIIDSDHWRHFFLILGLIWGMAAANSKLRGNSSRANGAAPNRVPA